MGSAFRRETEIEDAELWCSSFEEKTAEDYLSTRWFARRFTELTQTQVAGVKEMMLQKNFAAETRQVFEQFAGNLARLIYQQCAAHGYTHVVLGGNIMQARPAFHDQLLFNLTQLGTEVQIKYAVLGEDAALLGSAGMAWRKTYYR